jgi:thiamine pyrophosphokinase
MSKKIKIFCGPNQYNFLKLYSPEEDDYIVGVDSGLEYLLKHHIPIDLAVGDFDSLQPDLLDVVMKQSKKVLELDTKKNMTDLAFAIDYLYNHMDYQSITVYGGIGGRIDHFLANVNLIKQYDLEFIDDQHRLYPLRKGRYTITNQHQYISFFAIEDVYDLTMRGFAYELDQYYLSTTDSLCVSNQGSGELEFSKGRLLIVMTNDSFIP